MKASKQVSIVLAASVLAFGAVTVAPQQADASMATNILIPNVHQYLLQQVMLIQPWVLQ
ncbi:MAG: hypothetical protein ACLRZ2_09445 [Veillonella sp.]